MSYYLFYMFFIISYVLYKLCLNVPIAFVLSFLISQIMAFAMSTKYTIYISRRDLHPITV